MDIHIPNSSDIKKLESQIHVKKEDYKNAIQLGKEFAELKVIRLEVKKLEKELQSLQEKNISH